MASLLNRSFGSFIVCVTLAPTKTHCKKIYNKTNPIKALVGVSLYTSKIYSYAYYIISIDINY